MSGKDPFEAAMAAGVPDDAAAIVGNAWAQRDDINPKGYGRRVPTGRDFTETDILDGLWTAFDMARVGGSPKSMVDALKVIMDATSKGASMSHLVKRSAPVTTHEDGDVIEGEVAVPIEEMSTEELQRIVASDTLIAPDTADEGDVSHQSDEVK
jgi:hypothetical protein